MNAFVASLRPTSWPRRSPVAARRCTGAPPAIMEPVESRVLLSFNPNPATWEVVTEPAPETGITNTVTATDRDDPLNTYRYFATSVPHAETSQLNYIAVFRVDQSTGVRDAGWGVHKMKPANNGFSSSIKAVDLAVGGGRVALLWSSAPLQGMREGALSAWSVSTGAPIQLAPPGTPAFAAATPAGDGYSLWLHGAMPDGWQFTPSAVDVQDDGKFLLVGVRPSYSPMQPYPGAVIWRLDGSGGIDTGFAAGGWYTSTAVASFTSVTHIGSAIFAGTYGRSVDTGRPLILKLTASGAPDSSFASGPLTGYASPYPTGTTPYPNAMASSYSPVLLGPDAGGGRLLVGSYAASSNGGQGGADFLVVNAADGTLNGSFGPGGSGHFSPSSPYGLMDYDPDNLNTVVMAGGGIAWNGNPGGIAYLYDAGGNSLATVVNPYNSQGQLATFLPDHNLLFVSCDQTSLFGQELTY